MSGICGIVRLDGGKVESAEIAALTAALERRGPEGTRQWLGGSAGLGHTLLATTPEALVEVLPLTDKESGCTITADARLDNREELLPALSLNGESRVIGDGELILHAYLRWGDDCPKHLLGDFAFAIWDERSESLFAARDHMGMRQLIYHHQAGSRFVFATEAEAVLADPAVPRKVSEGRVADFLEDLEGFDLTSTFFEQVYRLPPAHRLRVAKDGLSLRRYWRLEPGPALELPSDEAYAHAFLDKFIEAVRCRLRSPGPVGAMLSGGVDSGAMVAVASNLLQELGAGPLPVFSAVGPDPGSCIETRSIQASAAVPGISSTFVNYANLDAYADDLMRLTRDSAEPFDAHMVLIRAVYLAAHRTGLKVVLDGVAGDVTLTSGNCVAEWLRRGRVRRAWREAASEQRFLGDRRPVWLTLARAAWVAFAPLKVRRLRRRLIRQGPHSWRGGICIDRDFALRSRIDERRRNFWRHTRIVNEVGRAQRALAVSHPNLVTGRERYDRVAGELGMEPRDPFMDVRLIQFCLSLPTPKLRTEGWPKLVLRRAMSGRLPESVIWRPGKEHLGPRFIDAMFQRWPGWREAAGEEIPGIARIAGRASVRPRNQATAKALDSEARITLFHLECWLRRSMGTATEA